jgi:branched-chain amino acid transport system permease protein
MDLTFSYIDQILIYLIFAGSLNLLIGYAGIFSTAHAVFGAFGGYAVAYLVVHHGTNMVVGVVLGIVFAVGLAIVIGLPALRLDLAWIILLTLAVQQVVVGVLGSLDTFGGSYGIPLTKVPFFGKDLISAQDVFPICLVLAAIIFALCWRLGESPYGRVLRGIRENEIATRALGKRLFTYKMTVMLVTAGMAAVAGALLTVLFSVAQPALFGFNASIAMIAMVIIGGRGSLIGTALGATLITLSTPFLQNVVDLDARVATLWQSVVYGVALAAVMYLRPKGLIPEGLFPRRRVGTRFATAGASLEDASAARITRFVAEERIEGEEAARAPARAPVAVAVHDVAKAFGGVRAVDGLSLELRTGRITALVGPNGAGKTTVFNLLTGEIPPDRGRVELWGEDITRIGPDATARRGLVRSFQDVKLFPDLSAHENVMLAIQGHPGERARNLFIRPGAVRRFEREAAERAYHWLEFVGMQEHADARAGSLGYGQQKLVAIARVLATDAEVLLLDEPASGIDHGWVDQILDLISRLRDTGKTICIVEHNLHVVGRLADHVYFMELGRVTAEGELAELTSDQRLAEAYFGSL